LGRTLLALYIPIFVFTIVESLLKVENTISRVIFAILCCALSIFLTDFLFDLLFWKGTISFVFVVNQIIITSLLLGFSSFILSSIAFPKERRQGYLR
jgi:hypothetical protein